MKVDQILQAKGGDVFSVKDGDSISDAVAILSEKNIGAVLVRDSAGGVVGILSERDIVRRLGGDGPQTMDKTVRSCMTEKVVTCAPEETIDSVMVKMTARRIRHMPVMRGGELVGIVSIGDVVKRKIEESEQEAAALRDYIASVG